MIIKVLMTPFWALIDLLISLLPSSVAESLSMSSVFDILGKGVSVIGLANFSLFLGSAIFWYTVQLTWAVIEWLYKKIPGVD